MKLQRPVVEGQLPVAPDLPLPQFFSVSDSHMP